MQRNKKFCPRCGALIHVGDTYCIRCGYSFRRRGRGTNLRTIIIAVGVLLGIWVVVRILTKQPIIPTGIINLFKNMTSNKTG
jgi:predicted nucleic acid-binding Zn ribbon protein